MKTIIEILKEHFEYRSQLLKLARADMNKTYRGSVLGWSWALIRPAVTIFVFWFAFSVGLRHGKDVSGYPFFLWLIAGMIPWFYMRDMITGGANSIRRYTYLVTKIKFPIATIPTFVSLSLMAVHIGLLLVMIALFVAFGFPPDIYYLQLPLYMIMMYVFFTIWGLFAGVLSAMSRDFLNLVKSLVTALFWLSGILYNAQSIEIHWIKTILLFNPVTLIANGYRNVFIEKVWFWQEPRELVNFALVTLVMLILAIW
ncbi:MAG: ABC transporter permease, partial [Anaerovoracaceae bacterium]